MALQQRGIKHKNKGSDNIKKAYEKITQLKCMRCGYEANAAQNILRRAGLARQ